MFYVWAGKKPDTPVHGRLVELNLKGGIEYERRADFTGHGGTTCIRDLCRKSTEPWGPASNGIPASPHQVQVLGLSESKGTENGRFSSTRKGLGNTYNGLPVSRHQLEVFGFRSNFAVLPSVATAIAIGADWADPALDRIAAIEGKQQPAREVALLSWDTRADFSEPLRQEATSMKTMQAVRIHTYGGPEVLKYEEAPLPKPGPGEALAKHI